MTASIQDGADSLAAFFARRGRVVSTWDARVLDDTTDERMVVEYAIRHRSGAADAGLTKVIGKFYCDDTGNASLQNMQAIRALLLKSSATKLLNVPTAYYYDEGIRFLAMQRVPGAPYPELVQCSDFRKHLSLAGHALACLHSLDPVSERLTTLEDHIAELIRPHPCELARNFPEYRAQIDQCLEDLLRQQSEWRGRIKPSPIHRDYQLRQLFYAQPTAWLIDWDLFATGDPAFDVAYFAVYLRTHLPKPRADAATEAFLSAYRADRSDEVMNRLPAYESFNYLRRACRRFRLKDEGWEDQVQAMLGQIGRR